jgi:hypothetical protein
VKISYARIIKLYCKELAKWVNVELVVKWVNWAIGKMWAIKKPRWGLVDFGESSV